MYPFGVEGWLRRASLFKAEFVLSWFEGRVTMNFSGFADKLECFVVFFGSLPSDSRFFVWGGLLLYQSLRAFRRP